MAPKNGVNGFAQGAGALAVNDAQLEYLFFQTGVDVVWNEILGLGGTEGVQIEDTVYGQCDRLSGIVGIG